MESKATVTFDDHGNIIQKLNKLHLDEYNSKKIRELKDALTIEQVGRTKALEHKVLDIWSEFPYFVNVDIIRFILRKNQGEQIILDKPYDISKEAIMAITGLCNVGPVPVNKFMQNKEVKSLIGVTKDQRALLIHTIVDPIVRYITYGISYKIYFRNREGSTSTIVIYITHHMVKKNE
jgi:hypothetical protein